MVERLKLSGGPMFGEARPDEIVEVEYRRVEAPVYERSRYEVVIGGRVVGVVASSLRRFPKRKVGRLVAAYGQELVWTYAGSAEGLCSGTVHSTPNTRRKAVAEMLGFHFAERC